MSTAVITQPISRSQRASQGLHERVFPFALITLLTLMAFVVHGYHPYSEDGGLYSAGIKHLLHPELYPHSLPFVEAHQRFSLFAPAVAAVVRLTHLNLEIVLLGIHLASIWGTLFAVWLLARRCYSSRTAQAGAVMLTAAWLTVPVAGTSLILMDPYVTARSISLPCGLLAITALLDLRSFITSGRRLRSLALCSAPLVLAAVVHPLMAAYTVGDVVVLAAILSWTPWVRRWGAIGLCFLALGVAGILQSVAPADSEAYLQVVITRYYWFLSQWQWYEIVGLVAPLLILAIVAILQRPASNDSSEQAVALKALAAMAIFVGVTAILVALAFAHESFATHIVARLQPLRSFQTIYMVMILVLGATLGEYLLQGSLWRWIAAFAVFGSIMFYAQRSTYPSSTHIEWPGATPANRWEQAFTWISHNTLPNALFAMDANYISLPGEDAQSFRAIAERSALPDYSKDGGEASITPSLTALWTAGQQAQSHLSAATDTERLAALRPLAVDWVVLQEGSKTIFICPYQNDLVKVCRLR